MAKKVIAIAALAPLKRGFFQKRTSSIGYSTRRSHQKNTARRLSPPKKNTRISVVVQPFVGASITAYSNADCEAMDSNAPIRSKRGAFGSLELGIKNTPAMRPNATIGRFTRKIEPQ